jgi:hypothetical protein
MTSFEPPANPKEGDRWHDEFGDVWIWDGKKKDWLPFEDVLFPPTSTVRDDE